MAVELTADQAAVARSISLEHQAAAQQQQAPVMPHFHQILDAATEVESVRRADGGLGLRPGFAADYGQALSAAIGQAAQGIRREPEATERYGKLRGLPALIIEAGDDHPLTLTIAHARDGSTSGFGDHVAQWLRQTLGRPTRGMALLVGVPANTREQRIAGESFTLSIPRPSELWLELAAMESADAIDMARKRATQAELERDAQGPDARVQALDAELARAMQANAVLNVERERERNIRQRQTAHLQRAYKLLGRQGTGMTEDLWVWLKTGEPTDRMREEYAISRSERVADVEREIRELRERTEEARRQVETAGQRVARHNRGQDPTYHDQIEPSEATESDSAPTQPQSAGAPEAPARKPLPPQIERHGNGWRGRGRVKGETTAGTVQPSIGEAVTAWQVKLREVGGDDARSEYDAKLRAWIDEQEQEADA